MKCPYCGSSVVKRSSRLIYRRSYGWLWVCSRYPECDAYVGCHKGTDKPLGRLANATLRRRKMEAHAAFDPLWQAGEMKRSEAYAWLAKQLGIPAKRCHIGEFDVDTCNLVVQVCEARLVSR
jgi:ssDNA-binding Zn-finger/Zn-ribbon topoisomerase 1